MSTRSVLVCVLAFVFVAFAPGEARAGGSLWIVDAAAGPGSSFVDIQSATASRALAIRYTYDLEYESGKSLKGSPDEIAGEPCPLARASGQRLVERDVLEMFTTRFDDSSSRALGWD